MLNRTYIVLMPNSNPTAAFDIFVQSKPGTQAVPIKGSGSTSDAAYYEQRGRSIRFEQLALLPSTAANPAFSPRGRLGIQLGIQPLSTNATAVPGILLSSSFGSLSTTDAGPTINITALADDTTNGPRIRLLGHANTAGLIFMITIYMSDARDEERSPAGN